jgi:hypothetical protein
MSSPLSQDKQRIKLYLLLRLISEHEKVSEYLSLPCTHKPVYSNQDGTCDECDREDYLATGCIHGIEDDAA